VLIVVFALIFVATLLCIVGLPVYVIGERSGVSHPAIAFVPFVGFWIVLFESIRRSGWLAFLAFIPYAGIFIVAIWTAIEIPQRHGRSQWWTAALIVPILNIPGYWVYAFTLRNERELTLFAAA